MVDTLTLPVVGNLGTDAGAGSNGVLIGALTAVDPTVGQLESRALTDGLCVTEDADTFATKSTEFNEATADDVLVLPATPEVDDATYFGHATKPAGRLDVNQTTQGVGTWTIAWETWNGSAWVAVTGLTDGTAGLTAAVGFVSVLYTATGSQEKTTVNGINAYWLRARVDTFTSVTTAPKIGQGYIVVAGADALFTDDLIDLTDVGTGDVALLPAYPVVGDGFYYGAAEKFCQLSVVYSQARTGTATISYLYWNGSAWTAIPIVVDDSAGYSATAGTHLVHILPPADWVANTAANGPGGEAGFHVKAELTAITTVTQQPLGTSATVLPIVTGALGLPVDGDRWVNRIDGVAGTVSGANADSIFALLNVTKGTAVAFTWAQTLAIDGADVVLELSDGDSIALVQVQEDGTTELADAAFIIRH